MPCGGDAYKRVSMFEPGVSGIPETCRTCAHVAPEIDDDEEGGPGASTLYGKCPGPRGAQLAAAAGIRLRNDGVSPEASLPKYRITRTFNALPSRIGFADPTIAPLNLELSDVKEVEGKR
jgi:hypothetical protein